MSPAWLHPPGLAARSRWRVSCRAPCSPPWPCRLEDFLSPAPSARPIRPWCIRTSQEAQQCTTEIFSARIHAKAQKFLLALKSVGKSPQFAAGGRHMQAQAAAVRKFLHLAVGLGIPHSGIRKFHVAILQNCPEVCSENQKNPPPSS